MTLPELLATPDPWAIVVGFKADEVVPEPSEAKPEPKPEAKPDPKQPIVDGFWN